MALQMVVRERDQENVYVRQYNCVLWMREVLLGHALEMQMMPDMHLRLFDPESGEQLAEFWYNTAHDRIRFTVGDDGKTYETDSMMLHITCKQIAKERWERMAEVLTAQVGIGRWELFENLTGAMCKRTLTERDQQMLNSEPFASMTHMGVMLLLARMKMTGFQEGIKKLELMLPGEILREMPSIVKSRLEGTDIKLVSCVIVGQEEIEGLPWG